MFLLFLPIQMSPSGKINISTVFFFYLQGLGSLGFEDFNYEESDELKITYFFLKSREKKDKILVFHSHTFQT
jgi:hypothetical protein